MDPILLHYHSCKRNVPMDPDHPTGAPLDEPAITQKITPLGNSEQLSCSIYSFLCKIPISFTSNTTLTHSNLVIVTRAPSNSENFRLKKAQNRIELQLFGCTPNFHQIDHFISQPKRTDPHPSRSATNNNRNIQTCS